MPLSLFFYVLVVALSFLVRVFGFKFIVIVRHFELVIADLKKVAGRLQESPVS